MAGLAQQAVLLQRVPWQWLRGDGPWGPLVTGLMAALWCAGGLAAGVWLPGPQAAVVVGILAAILLLGWWSLQFSALLRLDHPHAAQLVPGHQRAVRTAALVQWLLVALLCTGVALLVARGLAGLDGLPVLLVGLAACAVLLWTAMALRWWWMWVLVWLPFPVVDVFGGWSLLKWALEPLRTFWQAQPVLGSLLAVVAMGAALCGLFGQADAAHARAYAGRERLRKIEAAGAAGQKPALAAYGRWGEVLGAPFQALADAWLARLLRGANPRPASVTARVEVVLFGAQHWVRQLAALVLVHGLALGGIAVLVHFAGKDLAGLIESSPAGLSIGLAALTISPLLMTSGALWVSRREQALLMLLPGMPQGPALNQRLARRQWCRFLWLWLCVLPFFGALAWWGQAPQALGFVGAALPVAAVMWPDVSRMRSHNAPSILGLYLLHLGLGFSSLLLLRWQPTLLLPWALGMVVLTLALLAWRWRCVSQWPQALPAGRRA